MRLKTTILIPIMAIFMMVFSHAVHAQEFTVRDIAVDVTGDTLIDAKGKALDQARRNGFTVLMRRMGALSSESKIKIPDDATISSFVSNFEINREKASKNRYLASVNVTFNERATQAYIAQNSSRVMPDNTEEPVVQAETQNPSNEEIKDNYVVQNDVYDIQKYRQNTIGQTKSIEPTAPVEPIVSGKITTYNTLIPVKNLGEWVRVQKILFGMPAIRNLAIQSMNSSQVLVNLTHQGTPAQLLSALKSYGLMLYSIPQPKPGQAPYVLVIQGQ